MPPQVDTSVPSSRREYKYLLPMRKLDALRQLMRGAASLDPNSTPGDDPRYTIDSLYYDAPDMKLFHANRHEAYDRYKLRIRHYPDAPKAPVFLERKRRTGDAIRKIRIASSHATWQQDLHDLRNPVSLLVARDGLQPMLRVRYRREAWVSDLHPYARLSIDTEIEAVSCHAAHLHDLRGWRPVDTPVETSTDQPCGVVELKFTGPAPTLFFMVVQRLGLLRQAFGKYANGITAAGLENGPSAGFTEAAPRTVRVA